MKHFLRILLIISFLTFGIISPLIHQVYAQQTIIHKDIITKGPWVDSRSYATLELANTAAYNAGKLLVVSQNYTLTGANTLTASVMRIPGSSFTHTAGSTLAFSGKFQNPSNGHCFIGFDAGDVTFGAGAVKKFYPEWFGAVGGTTDDLLPIQQTINSMPSTGGSLVFTLSKYTVSSYITIDRPIDISGMGTEMTSLFTSSATANLLYITTGYSCYIHDITLDNAIPRSGGASIYFLNNNNSRIERVKFGPTNPGYCHVWSSGSNYWNISQSYFAGAVYGIYIVNVANPDSGDNTIGPGNLFAYGTTSNCFAIHIDSGGGLKIIGNKILGFEYAIDLNLQDSTGSLVINANSMEGQGTSSIRLSQGVSGKTFNGVAITGNQFSGATNWVLINTGNTAWLNHLIISGNTGYGPNASATAFSILGAAYGEISSNNLYGNGTSNAISLGVQATNINISNNNTITWQFPIICASTTSSIHHIGAGGMTYAILAAQVTEAANGSMIYVSDGTIANPVAGSGTGCIAKRLNGVWVGN